MNHYNQVATRYHKISGRDINPGEVLRVVAISEKDAAIMNGMAEEHGFKYVLVPEKKAAEEKPIAKTSKNVKDA